MKINNIKTNIFEKKFRAEKDIKLRERLQILWDLRRGYTQREVAKMLGVSNGIVAFWKQRFEREGFTGLYDKNGRGRKSAISEEQLSMLGSALSEGVLLEDGYRRGFITKDIISFIGQEFKKQYTPRHCRRLVANMGCSMQVPRPRNKSRNQEAVDAFKKEFKKNVHNWILQ